MRRDTTGAGAPVQDDPCNCKIPFDGQHIDHINQRIYQLHALFGVVRSMASKDAPEVDMAPEDLAGVAWLADDLLDEVEEHADKLHEHFIKGQASRPASKGRTQPSADAA